jgi:hypothetical protein
MFSVIWSLFTNFPTLVGVIVALEKEWETYKDDEDRAQKVQALKDAITKAKASGDTSALTTLVNGIITGQLPPSS